MEMKIGARLAATFGAILVLLLAICVMVSAQMSRMDADAQAIVSAHLAKVRLVANLKENEYMAAWLVTRALTDAAEVQKADLAQLSDIVVKNTALYHELDTRVQTPQGRAIFDRLAQARQAYKAAFVPVLDQLAAHDGQAQASLQGMVPVQTTVFQLLGEFSALANDAANAAGRESASAYDTARAVLWGSAALALIIALVLGVMVTRSIVGPLQRVVAGANSLAQGDLSVKIDVVRRDEVGVLAEAVNTAISQLARIVGGVKQASLSISSATQQLAAGNTDLSQRTEEQAASLEETASSMEELTATVRHNADNAQQATTLATTASGIAQRGGDVVGRVVETMYGISDSSAKMGEIIAVIEGIAFQTNILALNAAVEAARAGEQGRGFAVVAGEVRTLAQRSAAAAKEIKTLISASADQVLAGSKLVEEAGSTISEVVQSVRRVTDIIGEIASASQEQRTGIEQVNTAVSQMDQVTQQNAALVEQASAAAHSMAEQAQELRDAVAVFKVDDRAASAPRGVVPRSEPRPPAVAARTPSRATSATAPRVATADRETANAGDTGAVDWQAF